MMKIALAALAALSLRAFAEGSTMGSEYMYQTPADKWNVTPSISYSKLDVDYKAGQGLTGASLTRTTFGVRGEYGISEMFATGLILKSTSLNTDYSPSSSTEPKSSGLEDLRAFFNGRMDLGMGSLRFGTDVILGLEKQEKDGNGLLSNNASGGLGLEPFVGFEMYSNAITYGTKLAYLMYLGDRKGTDKSNSSTNDEAYTMTGSEVVTWSLFFEYAMSPMTLGASFEWDSKAKETETYDTSKSKTIYASLATQRLNLYLPYEINPMITVLPKLTYTRWSAFNDSAISGADGTGIELAARFAF